MKRPRINMIIGKKQIIIAGLTLLLGIAIYVNYLYASSRNIEDSVDAGEKANYGDVQFVSGGSVDENDDITAYFAQARLAKRESRDEAKEFLQSMVSGGDVFGEEIQVIAQDATSLGNFIESEAKIETVLKAQGFRDVLCYLSDRGANIIVRVDSEGLTAADAAKIKDALLSEVSVAAENITIVEIS